MKDQSRATQDQSEMDVIFVHSELDDRNLTLSEFRIYCHLARRAGKGTAFPGIRSMASVCRMSKPTAIAAVKSLESTGMITAERKSGSTTNYMLTAKSKWSKIGNTATGKNGVTHRSNLGNGTGQNGVTKGNPPKEIQLKESKVVFPAELDTAEFKAAWQDWTQHRREKRCPLTPTSIGRQMKMLAGLGPVGAVRVIEQALEHGWQGLYPVKGENGIPKPDTNKENVRLGKLADAARAAGDEETAKRLDSEIWRLG